MATTGLFTPGTALGNANLVITRGGALLYIPVNCSVMDPVLPLVVPDVSTRPVFDGDTGTSWWCDTSADLTHALANCALGDEIVLNYLNVFAGTFTLRSITTGTGWVTIRTSNVGELPPRGTMAWRSDSINMPTITVPSGGGAAIKTAPGAHHYWFLGVEVTNALGVTQSYGAILLGDGSSAQNDVSLVPHHIVIDQSYVHGSPGFDCSRGVSLDCGWAAIVDSYISEWHDDTGSSSDDHDTQAVGGWNGTGPFLLRNSLVEGAGENTMWGGADSAIPGNLMYDITVDRLYYFKPPAWYSAGYSVKNLCETKSAQRVLYDSCIFENNWPPGQDGTAIIVKSVNQSNHMPWSETKDVTFRNSILRNTTTAFNFSGHPDDGDTGHGPAIPASRVLVKNFLVERLGADSDWSGDNKIMRFGADIGSVRISHLTALGGNYSTYFALCAIPQLVIEDSILGAGDSVIIGDSVGAGVATLKQYALPGWVCRNNVLVGADSGLHPKGNFFPANRTTLGLNPDMSLPTGSPYIGAASDGADVGADVAGIYAACAGVDAGRIAPVGTIGRATNAASTPLNSTAFNAVAGSMVVVGVAGTSATFAPVLTDTAGNSYALAGTIVTNGTKNTGLYVAHNIAGNAANVIQFTDSTSVNKAMFWMQFSGAMRKTTPFDVAKHGTGTATGAYATPGISSGAPNEVEVVFAADDLGGTLGLPAAFTFDAAGAGYVFGYQLVRSIYNKTVAVTDSNSGATLQAVVALFK